MALPMLVYSLRKLGLLLVMYSLLDDIDPKGVSFYSAKHDFKVKMP